MENRGEQTREPGEEGRGEDVDDVLAAYEDYVADAPDPPPGGLHQGAPITFEDVYGEGGPEDDEEDEIAHLVPLDHGCNVQDEFVNNENNTLYCIVQDQEDTATDQASQEAADGDNIEEDLIPGPFQPFGVGSDNIEIRGKPKQLKVQVPSDEPPAVVDNNGGVPDLGQSLKNVPKKVEVKFQKKTPRIKDV